MFRTPDAMQKFAIQPLDDSAMEKARFRLDNLVKPPGSLGKLEDIAIRLAGITGQLYCNTSKRCVIIICSDNGVVNEGVAAAPQSVTFTQTLNFTRGITGAAVLAKLFNSDLIIVDAGVNADIDHPHVKNKKIRKSTGNIAREAAMTYEEALHAVLCGVETAIEAVNNGYRLIGAGEMGIGNTTTSAAVLSALTGLPPEKTAGKGAGLSNKVFQKKIDVIRKALQHNNPAPNDPLDVLAKVGGLDIAALAGLFIGGAFMRVPVVIDGFISMTAALAAFRIMPAVRDYMFASHLSAEPGYRYASEALGMEPCLHLDMRLGEGSGCPLMFMLMDAASALIRDMGTFEEANIDEEYLKAVKDADFHIRGL